MESSKDWPLSFVRLGRQTWALEGGQAAQMPSRDRLDRRLASPGELADQLARRGVQE